MSKFEENWWLYFVPECYFDTVLLKKLLQTDKRLMHRKGCNNVVRDLDSPRLQNSFAVALIDKDKNDLDYLKRCDPYHFSKTDKIILWKHKSRQQFVIQLNPPLEKWIVEILDENGLKIENFGYARDFRKLKKQIKDDINSDGDGKLNKLINAIIKTDCATIKKLKSILHTLKDKNYQVDINELRNV